MVGPCCCMNSPREVAYELLREPEFVKGQEESFISTSSPLTSPCVSPPGWAALNIWHYLRFYCLNRN